MLHDRTKRRIGFTLVEILVVVAIITVLAGLGAWAFFGMIGRTHSRNTEATMKVVNKLMLDRWSAVIADAKKETPSPAAVALANGPAGPAGNLDPSGKRAQVIMVKIRLMEAFPMTYAEVNTPTVLNTFITKPKPYFAKYQTTLFGKAGGLPGESAACLLMALKTLGSDGVSVEDQLSYAVADTDGDGVKELIDGWSKPVKFNRFATGPNIQLANPALGQPNSTTFKYSDPGDPDGLLLTSGWYSSLATYPVGSLWPGKTAKVVFESTFHTIARPAPPVGPNACYVIPVITSAGQDNVFGNGDDIESFKLRLE